MPAALLQAATTTPYLLKKTERKECRV
jgi:hypothetical protein